MPQPGDELDGVVDGEFGDQAALKSLFVDSRIIPWRDRLPSADDTQGRVRAAIDFLYEQRNAAGENALLLFLQVLSEQFNADDACRQELRALLDTFSD